MTIVKHIGFEPFSDFYLLKCFPNVCIKESMIQKRNFAFQGRVVRLWDVQEYLEAEIVCRMWQS